VIKAYACLGALEEGRHVHEQIMQCGCESDVFGTCSLVDMYAKCGSIEDAWRMFYKMPFKNVVHWNAMILGLVKCGQGQEALELFQQLQQEALLTCMQNVGAWRMLGEYSIRCHHMM
jgi:pentatricopeptide repeat protein